MTERPYETTVPDDLTTSTTSTNSTLGDASVHGGAYPPPQTADGSGVSVGDEAKSVVSDAADSGRRVADTAASGVKDVASEATTQLRQLFDQLRSELDDQASSQGQRAVSGLRSLADELRQMASSTQQPGLASETAHQAADRAGSMADWLDNRQPGDLLDELRSFARRRPGAFLLGAAAVGVIGGRMTRSLTGDATSTQPSRMTTGVPSSARPPAAMDSGYAAPAAVDSGYAAPAAVDSGYAAPVPPAPEATPPPRDPYPVDVREDETHAVTTDPEGVTPDYADPTFTEGQAGVRR